MKIKIIHIILILFTLILLLIISLFIYKNISRSKELITVKDIIKNENDMIASGSIGKYPILLKSTDNGKTWREEKITFLSLIPSNSIYYLNSYNKTIWIHEYTPCIECDFSNELKGIYYSHDFGKNWKTIDNYKISKSNILTLKFYNKNQGELKDERKSYFNTNDGGKIWNKGKLENKPKIFKNSTKKIFFVNSKEIGSEYILYLKDGNTTKQNIGVLPREINKL